MTIGNIGHQPSPLKWLDTGWSTLKDHAHNAITHFTGEDHDSGADESPPGQWGLLSVDVVQRDDEIEARFEIPGVDKDALNVVVRNGQLIVSGEKRVSEERQEGEYFITERAFGRFQRAVALPSESETDGAAADYEDGVLTVRIPRKTKADEPTPIEIRRA